MDNNYLCIELDPSELEEIDIISHCFGCDYIVDYRKDIDKYIVTFDINLKN